MLRPSMRAIAAELPLPHFVTQHDDVRPAEAIVGRA